MTSGDAVLVVDKPPGLTSHDVVARVRRLARMKRVGHAGTLDPMATGVLVVGTGRATRVLGYVSASTKCYEATVRLGISTVTDDAEGEPSSVRPAAGLGEERVREAAAGFTGEVSQVPPAYSAVKVNGVRSYARARRGEEAELPVRSVTVHTLVVDEIRPGDGFTDVDVRLECSSGTYVRALARDLGECLGVGGHLTRLRRTVVGPYRIEEARTLDELAQRFEAVPLDIAVARTFPRRDVSAEDTRRVSHGGRLAAAGYGSEPVGVFGPDGALLALMREEGGEMRPLAVFAPG